MKQSTRRDYEVRVLRVQQAVERALDSPHSPAEFAKIAGLSPQHFHRIFRALTGETLMSFSRRVRLERAARRLLTSMSSVTEVALEAGYGSHEAFTRAFVMLFDCAPKNFRNQSPTRVVPQSDLSPEASKVTLRRWEPQPMLFIRNVGEYASTGIAWMRLIGWLQDNASTLGIDVPQMYGRSHDDPYITEATKLRYDAVVLLPSGADFTGDPSAGVTRGELRGGLYASCVHRGDYAELGQSYLQLIGHWFPSRGHVPAAEPVIERYLNSPGATPPADLLTEIRVRIDERRWLKPPVMH